AGRWSRTPVPSGPRCRSGGRAAPVKFFGAPEVFKAHGLDIPGGGDFSTYPIALKSPAVAGTPDVRNAASIIKSIEMAVRAVEKGQASAVVTCPIHKKSLLDAGFNHAGHTAFLGELTGATPVMMLATEDFRVVPVTTHVPLKNVSKLLTKKLIITTAKIVAKDLTERFGIAKPRLAFTGLNPHAGEEGALGSEETRTIIPAIKELQAMGYHAQGPFPADTAFTPAMRMKFDVFFAMTHDQALIPVKTLDYRKAVNITLGLPIIRTSPAHGTAFDLVREGRTPDPESFIQALVWAKRLAQ
ncbi:MAG: 4-hydroxythreonine-4-phosphate dehydrogenase PdxA, partial [Sphingomonadales bacterium]